MFFFREEQFLSVLVNGFIFLPKIIKLLHSRDVKKLVLATARLVVTSILEHVLHHSVTGTMVLAALVVTGCSSSDLSDEPSNMITTETMQVETSDQSRVTNYQYLGSTTRATSDVTTPDTTGITMGDEPSVPSTATNVTEHLMWGTTFTPDADNASYVMDDFSGAVNFNGKNNITIYVRGTWKYTNAWGAGTGTKIIVLSSGSIDLSSVSLLTSLAGVSLYNYSDKSVLATNGTLAISNGNSLYTTTGLTLTGNFTAAGNAGNIYVKGDISANAIDIENGYKLNAQGNMTSTGNTTFNSTTEEIGGNLVVGGTLQMTSSNTTVSGDVECSGDMVVTNSANAKVNDGITADNLTISGTSCLLSNCRNVIAGNVYCTNTSILYIHGYLSAADLLQDSSSKLIFHGSTLVNISDVFSIQNVSTNSVTNDDDDENNRAVINTNTLKFNSLDLSTTITGNLALNYSQLNYNDNGTVYTEDNPGEVWNTVKFNSGISVNSGLTNVKAWNCVPEGTTDDDTPYLEPIADVESPDHQHYISATCVDVNGDKAYVSYHTQGTGIGGCIETLNFADEMVTLKNYLRSDTLRDFNHIYVDDGVVFAAGNDYKKGGILEKVELASDGYFPESGSADELEVIRLAGTKVDGKYAKDGNCIVRKGDNYYIASTEGFETRSADDLSSQNLKNTDAQGKFVSLDESGSDMVTLNLANNDGSQADAVINVYSASDNTFSSPKRTITVTDVTPVDGKNVCKIDGGNIYACLGYNGLAIYGTSGTDSVLNWKPTPNSRVNGIDFDDNYLYVACGSAGVYVLDKAEALKGNVVKIAAYTHQGQSAGGNSTSATSSTSLKSANYIHVTSDGYIFVAFGLDGFQVYKLVE